MCGIIGIAGFRDDLLVERMSASIIHRGPDDYGSFFSDEHSIAMQRLSIIDLASGHQPMFACEGKVTIVFNGEIYNYREIREQLEAKGHIFATHSDTETILLGYVEWGLKVIDKLIGMFGIAISDRRGKPVLYLIRDRVGVKPLYYHFQEGRLTFGSEMKAVLANPRIHRELNPWAVHHYLKLRYVPGDDSLIKGVEKLPAGCWLKYEDGSISIQRYWSASFPSEKPPVRFDEAMEKLEHLLEASIKRRLVADVPVGAYLSGGLDSAVIVALMTKFHSGPVNTFSIGFRSENDETSQAAETARYLGSRHHEIYCEDTDFKDLEKIVWHLDEPIGDAIVLPMYLLARESRKHVKVILAGEGADELFGGYLFHKALKVIATYKRWMPKGVRDLGRKTFEAIPHQLINKFFAYPADLGETGKRKMVEFLKSIETQTIEQQYRNLISLFSDSDLNQVYSRNFQDSLQQDYFSETLLPAQSTLDRILAVQYRDWLPDDILMKLDKMTMAHSLEGREPFLDHELIAYVNSLPDSFKVKGWKDKYILRQVAKKILPPATVNRRKSPFYIPIDEYFNRPTFKRLYESFRDENYLENIFNTKYIEALDLTQKSLLESKKVFSLMILNTWFKAFMGRNAQGASSLQSSSEAQIYRNAAP